MALQLFDLFTGKYSNTTIQLSGLGGFIIAFSLFSVLMKEIKIYLNEVVLGTVFGIIIGPHGGNILNPRSWSSSLEYQNNITLEVIRIILGVGLFIIGVKLPENYMWKHASSLLAMVIPTMAFGWLLVGGILKVLFPSLTFVSCLVIAACLTPTDPIICSAIVAVKKFAKDHVHIKLRQILSAESAANDGLAYPFLSISIYLTVESSKRVAFGKWFLIGWLYQVILGVILGAVMGLFSSRSELLERSKGHVDRESYVAQLNTSRYIAMALFTVGLAHTIGSDDLLAAFATGTALSWDGHFTKKTKDKQMENDKQTEETEKETFVSALGLCISVPGYLSKPLNMPSLGIVPWKLTVLFISTIFLRRIPPLMLLSYWVPEIGSWKKALFSGHFETHLVGPMGVGAVFISTLALTELSPPHNPPRNQEELLALYIQPVVAFIVLGSSIIHGLSIPFYSLWSQFLIPFLRQLTCSNGTSPVKETSIALDTISAPIPDVERALSNISSFNNSAAHGHRTISTFSAHR
ncbi:Cation/H+ exchanger [Rhodocollybia butyracea]|uniref:Cation/H+ exchanger n=1 Tax=Rhodocollybia butyracea TaxID=206335 RepID=A0A9P5PZ14_9AGAR|nr:Cation/H+ exchanger [Rhodocollybia butyracea]